VPDFHTQHGDPQLADQWRHGQQVPDQRRFLRGQNPYIGGSALPPDSPVFYGRDSILHSIRARLFSPAKPQSISLLGERRIGKSSLLNRLVASLATEPGLLVLHASMQEWSDIDPPGFFRRLHLGLYRGLGLEVPAKPFDRFERVRDLVEEVAQQCRFVIVLDEFEHLAVNPRLDQTFFANLRTLGYDSRYQLGYLTASRRSLEQLCHEHRIDESSFWNIFGLPKVLGLLDDAEADALIREPVHACLGRESDPTPVLDLAGNHPAFIQMLMFERFEAQRDRREPDWAIVGNGLRSYYQKLWDHRSLEEQHYLARVAAGEAVPDDPIGQELRVRGLLGSAHATFAPGFSRFVQMQNTGSDPVREEDKTMPTEGNSVVDNPFSMPLRVLQSAIQAVPVVKYALGVAGIGAAAAIIDLMLKAPHTAFLSLVGMIDLLHGRALRIRRTEQGHTALDAAQLRRFSTPALHGHLQSALHLGLLPVAPWAR
jgi:hypothetical protein